MRSATRLFALLLTAAFCPAAPVAQGDDTFPLEVSVEPRSPAPGDLVLVTVAAARALAGVEGEAFGRQVHFWPGAGRAWHGLVAVGLDAGAGQHRVTIEATGTRGGIGRGGAPVAVRSKTFDTRRLRVAPRYATPPAEAAERIAREAKLLEDLFAQPPGERLWSGPFDRPVPGDSTSSFGRRSVVNGQAGSPHLGADFRARTGTPVASPNAGRVVLAQELYFAGKTVVIDHGLGLFSLFAHLSAIEVHAGMSVARGDLLGHSGGTGRVTAPHLHWAVRLGQVAADPLSLLAATSALETSPPSSSAKR
jgi:murein DD-endopeptidase MepM/ murein hydrolase activator NlpD